MAGIETLSVAELERMLENRRAELTELTEKRERLAAELAECDRQIAEMNGGAVRGRGRGRGRRVVVRKRRPGRVRNQPPLKQFVADVLEKHKKGLSLDDLSERVLGAGYKTNSGKFKNTLYQTLYNSRDRFDYDSGTKLYRLKPE